MSGLADLRLAERIKARRGRRAAKAAGGNAPVRVLLVIDEMEVGGTQRQILQLARALDPHRFRIEVVYFRFTSFLVDELKSLGVPVYQCIKRGRLDPWFLLHLRARIFHGRYDIVHAFSFSSELWCAVALRSRVFGRAPVFVSSVRGTYEWYTRTQWQIKAWVSGQSGAIVANSVAGARYAAYQTGLPEERIVVVHNGMPEPAAALSASGARQRTRADMGLADDAVLVLFVGRLVELKNVTTLLDAFAQARDDARLRLAIVGDGPLRGDLRQQADALDLTDRVLWLGERRDVPALMNACDMVVLPSLREGLSNVIVEAMFMGKPVLASRVGGNEESVVDGETGLIFEAGDAAELAACMQRVATDAALGLRLGEAGRARARAHFSLAALADNMAALYSQLLGRDGEGKTLAIAAKAEQVEKTA